MTAPFRPRDLSVAPAPASRPEPQAFPPQEPGSFLARRRAEADSAAANMGARVAANLAPVTGMSAHSGGKRIGDAYRFSRREDFRASLAAIAERCALVAPQPASAPIPWTVAGRIGTCLRYTSTADWPWGSNDIELAADALRDAAHFAGVNLSDSAVLRPVVVDLFAAAEALAEEFLILDGVAPPLPAKLPLKAIRAALSSPPTVDEVRLRLPGYGIIADSSTIRRGKHGTALAKSWHYIEGRWGVIWFGHDLGLTQIGPARSKHQAIGAFARALYQLSRAPAPATQGD